MDEIPPGREDERPTEAPASGAPPTIPAEGPEISPCHLVKLIGEGGMGQVWRAEQQEPNRRQVALKLIITDETMADFRSETIVGASPESAQVLGGEAGHEMRPRAVACFLLLGTLCLATALARGEEPQTGASQTQAVTAGSPPPMLDDSIEAAESNEESLRKFTKWNHYEGPYATLKFGGSAMYDVATYRQDSASREQVGDLEAAGKWRDFRFVLAGTFPKVEWLTWKAGVMFDGPSQSCWCAKQASSRPFPAPGAISSSGGRKRASP